MNRVFRSRGDKPVDTFNEGLTLISALAAAAGLPIPLPTYSESGPCGSCLELNDLENYS